VRSVEYFPLGEPKAWDYGPNGRYERSYDEDGRVTSHTLGDETRNLDYDAAGRIVALADDSAEQADWSYTYDDADRLDTAANAAAAGATAGMAFDWSYDATGNRTTQWQKGATNPGTTSYQIDPASNRLDAVVTNSTDERTYDAVGNTIQWIATSGDFAGSPLQAGYGGR